MQMQIERIKSMEAEELANLDVEKIQAKGKELVKWVHNFLDEKIKQLQKNPTTCSLLVSQIKKIKLALKTFLSQQQCPA